MTDRYSIGFALQSSSRNSPIEPPAEPAAPVGAPDPFPIFFPGNHSGRSSPTTALDHTGALTPVRRNSDSRPRPLAMSAGSSQNPSSEWTVKLRIKPSASRFAWARSSSEVFDDDQYWNIPRYLQLTAYGERYASLVAPKNSKNDYKKWLLGAVADEKDQERATEHADLVIHSRRVSLDTATSVTNAPQLTNSTSSVGVAGSFAASAQQAVSVNGAQFNLPQIFPSRATAQLDALDIWRTQQHGTNTHNHTLSGGETTLSDLETTPRNSRPVARPSMDEKSYRPEFRVTSSLTRDSSDPAIESDKGLESRQKIGLKPLPYGWAKKDTDTAIRLSDGDCTAEYVSDKSTTVHEIGAVRTMDPIPSQCGIYYFEVEIFSSSSGDDSFSIGICDDECTMSKFPGFEMKSWGYHGDDGRIVACSGTSSAYGPKYGPGNVIGCGINFKEKTIFYTKDGVFLKNAFTDVTANNLYPTIGMKTGKKSRTNFGQDGFWFDIEQYVQEYKASLTSTILEEEPVLDEAGFYYPKGSNEIDELVKDVVGSYFRHEGFLEAAQAFEQERKQETQLEEPESKAEDDDDDDEEMADAVAEEALINQHEVETRQQVRSLVRQGDIDGALELLEEHYPQVLDKDGMIYFELQCHKFIGLIQAASKTGRKKGKKSNQALSEAIQYGQKLRQAYKEDKRPGVKEMLGIIFSLLAYEDPVNTAEVAGLFGNEGLKPLAEELNSAILISQGKPSVPFLEKLAQQSIQLVWELSDHEYDFANYINVRRDFLDG